METVYLCFVIVLFALAVFDLMVGVSNDAVNFLNSAIGSKSAGFRTIIIVAAIGVFCGASMSNGMMDIARHGIFRPEQFFFEDLMWIFLGVMVTDIVLLDVFNSLGMPTSTTVSMVFELLGGTFVLAIVKLAQADPGTLSLADLVNAEKALSVIIAIFVSVAIAFTFGVLVQYLTRLLFSFNFTRHLKYKIGIFGGVCATAIVYFMLIKGVKDLTFMTPDNKAWVNEHTWTIIGCSFAFFTVLMQLLHIFGVNVFKVIVLMGTFALATAFAGNDLVNFIGVPLAGFSAFNDWQAAGAPSGSLLMDSLNGPATTPTYFLIIAGLVMVYSLATSKKAQNVIKTSVDLSRQDEGDEMFGSSHMARWIVRNSSFVAETFEDITPKGFRRWVDSRFNRDEAIMADGAAFDLVRAAVNLVLAGLLIALGTSLKLPLSTTYVTFMVAMGTSLADRAWGRESAVYRITGVLSVIGGWLITAGAAFATCALVVAAMYFGGMIAAFALTALALFLLVRSNIQYRRKMNSKKGLDTWDKIVQTHDRHEAWNLLSEYVTENEIKCMDSAMLIYRQITSGFFSEDLKQLRRATTNVKWTKREHKKTRRREMVGMRKIEPALAIEKNTWYHLGQNSAMQVNYCLERMCEPCREHVDNNFQPVSKECYDEFMPLRNKVLALIEKTRQLLADHRYRDADALRSECDRVKEEISLTRKHQLDRMQNDDLLLSTGYVYLNMLQESQELISALRHMLRAMRNFQTSDNVALAADSDEDGEE